MAMRRTSDGLLINGSYSLAEAAHSISPKDVLPATTGDVTILSVCVQLTRSFRGGDSICRVRAHYRHVDLLRTLISPSITAVHRLPRSQALIRNIKEYAIQHGYGVMIWNRNNAESSDRHVLWSKIPALYYALVHLPTPYLWGQDADSLFVLPQRSLEFLKPKHGRSLTIAGDHNCYINSGHFMLRNTSWTAQVRARHHAPKRHTPSPTASPQDEPSTFTARRSSWTTSGSRAARR